MATGLDWTGEGLREMMDTAEEYVGASAGACGLLLEWSAAEGSLELSAGDLLGCPRGLRWRWIVL